jgi:hypothetical protein
MVAPKSSEMFLFHPYYFYRVKTSVPTVGFRCDASITLLESENVPLFVTLNNISLVLVNCMIFSYNSTTADNSYFIFR